MTAQTTQILLDASILSKSACMLRLALRTYYKYAPREDTNNSLIYGSAFHKCVETYWKSGNRDESAALLAAQTTYMEGQAGGMIVSKEHLDIINLTSTCLDWLRKVKYGSGHWLGYYEPVRDGAGNPIVEIKFAIPFIKHNNVEIILCGTIDGIYMINDILTIVDYKTTGSRNSSDFFRSYNSSTQLMLYTWALKWYAALEPATNNIYKELIDNSKMLGACIFASFLGTKDRATEFEQSRIQVFGDAQITEMINCITKIATNLIQEIRFIQDIPDARPEKEGLVNGSCQTAYGSCCPYFAACTSPSEDTFWGILDGHMKREPYDPRTFGGGTKEKIK